MENLYELLLKEFWEKHSLAALLYLLDGGREINFTYKGYECGIFRDYGKIYFDGKQIEEQTFSTAFDVLANAKIEGKLFCDIWEDIEIDALF